MDIISPKSLNVGQRNVHDVVFGQKESIVFVHDGEFLACWRDPEVLPNNEYTIIILNGDPTTSFYQDHTLCTEVRRLYEGGISWCGTGGGR